MASKEILVCQNCKSKLTGEVYMLSCMHNFCATCIKSMRDKTTTTCVLCDTAKNIEDVVRNNFIEKLISIQSKTDGSQNENINCQLCFPKKVIADNYCVDCEQYLCSKCSKKHLKSTVCFNHDVVDHNKIDKTAFMRKLSKCKKHNQDLTIYCKDCDVLTCAVCCAINHLNHNKDDDVNQIFEQSKQTIRQKIDEIDRIMETQQLHRQQNEEKKAEFGSSVSAIRSEIDARAKQLEGLIKEIHSEFNNKLMKYENNKKMILENKSKEINNYIIALNDFKLNLQSVVEKRSNLDIYLLKDIIYKDDWIENQKPKVSKNKNSLYFIIRTNQFNCRNLFGFLADSKIFILRNEVTSCCIIGDSLYAMDHENKRIDIYDVDSLMVKSSIDCRQYILHNSTYCLITKFCNTFFIYCDFEESGENKSEILKYDFNMNNFVKWKTIESCRLSSTNQGTVLVRTCSWNIIEYSVKGQELKKFEIPYNAIQKMPYDFDLDHQLNDGRYIVTSFNYKSVLINLLDAEGKLIKSFTKDTTAYITTCTDGEKYIFVLECIAGLITVLSTELQQIAIFNIPDAMNISYVRKEDKIIIVTSKEIHYIHNFQEY